LKLVKGKLKTHFGFRFIGHIWGESNERIGLDLAVRVRDFFWLRATRANAIRCVFLLQFTDFASCQFGYSYKDFKRTNTVVTN
jgi:hypothetical protein